MLKAYNPKPRIFVPVIIIGAGPTGLAASYLLKEADIAHLLLERTSTVASSWYNLWDEYHLAMPAEYVQFPGVNFAQHFGKNAHPKRDALIAFFHTYAEHYALPIKYNATVSLVHKKDDLFYVETASHIYVCHHVICCIGPRQVPAFPDEVKPLLQQTGIHVLHSSYYRSTKDFPRASNILVIGSGASALSIAQDIHNAQFKVSLACGYTSDEIKKKNKHLYSHQKESTVVPTLDDLIKRGIDNYGRFIGIYGNHLMFVKENQFHALPRHQFNVIILATGYTRSFDALNALFSNLKAHHSGLSGLFIAGIPEEKQQTVIIN